VEEERAGTIARDADHLPLSHRAADLRNPSRRGVRKVNDPDVVGRLRRASVVEGEGVREGGEPQVRQG
jgi:hypothetical protein